MPRERQTAPRDPGPAPDRSALHEAALQHLSRYAATEAGLVRVLDRRIARWERATGGPAEGSRAAAREVARALAGSGVIDDAVFAEARAKRLVRAGRSRRAVSAHLAAKGVGQAVASEALPSAEDEWRAAVAFTRRRRIGPFGGESSDRQRELAVFARAGFPRDVAERALLLDPEAAELLLAELKRG